MLSSPGAERALNVEPDESRRCDVCLAPAVDFSRDIVEIPTTSFYKMYRGSRVMHRRCGDHPIVTHTYYLNGRIEERVDDDKDDWIAHPAKEVCVHCGAHKGFNIWDYGPLELVKCMACSLCVILRPSELAA